jgi:hypothetical protein
MRTILVVRPDNRMRKFIATLIAGAVFAISASSATAEPSSPRHIAKGDLKQFCDKNKGQWTELGINGDNGFQCEIKGIGTWSCSVKENCTLSKTMVFNKPATNASTKTKPVTTSPSAPPVSGKPATAARDVVTPVANIPAPVSRPATAASARATPALGAGAFVGGNTPTLGGPAATTGRKLP